MRLVVRGVPEVTKVISMGEAARIWPGRTDSPRRAKFQLKGWELLGLGTKPCVCVGGGRPNFAGSKEQVGSPRNPLLSQDSDRYQM